MATLGVGFFISVVMPSFQCIMHNDLCTAGTTKMRLPAEILIDATLRKLFIRLSETSPISLFAFLRMCQRRLIVFVRIMFRFTSGPSRGRDRYRDRYRVFLQPIAIPIAIPKYTRRRCLNETVL